MRLPPYSHASETAQPGYYAVMLARYGIRAELTGTTRAALMRFTFPSTTQANVLPEIGKSIDGANTGSVSIVGDRPRCRCGRHSGRASRLGRPTV